MATNDPPHASSDPTPRSEPNRLLRVGVILFAIAALAGVVTLAQRGSESSAPKPDPAAEKPASTSTGNSEANASASAAAADSAGSVATVAVPSDSAAAAASSLRAAVAPQPMLKVVGPDQQGEPRTFMPSTKAAAPPLDKLLEDVANKAPSKKPHTNKPKKPAPNAPNQP